MDTISNAETAADESEHNDLYAHDPLLGQMRAIQTQHNTDEPRDRISNVDTASDDSGDDDLYAQDILVDRARATEILSNPSTAQQIEEEKTTKREPSSPDSPPFIPSQEYLAIDANAREATKNFARLVARAPNPSSSPPPDPDVMDALRQSIKHIPSNYRPETSSPVDIPSVESKFSLHRTASPTSLPDIPNVAILGPEYAGSDSDDNKDFSESNLPTLPAEFIPIFDQAHAELLADISKLPDHRHEMMSKTAVTDKYFPAEVFRKMRPHPGLREAFKAFYKFEVDVLPRLDPVVMMARVRTRWDGVNDEHEERDDAPGGVGDSAGANDSGVEDEGVFDIELDDEPAGRYDAVEEGETVDEHDTADEQHTIEETETFDANDTAGEHNTTEEHDTAEQHGGVAEGEAAVENEATAENDTVVENETAVEDEIKARNETIVQNERETFTEDEPASSNIPRIMQPPPRIYSLPPSIVPSAASSPLSPGETTAIRETMVQNERETFTEDESASSNIPRIMQSPPRIYSLPPSIVPSATTSPLPQALGRLRATESPLAPNPSPALSNDAGETLGNLTHLTERLQVAGDRADSRGVVFQSRFASPAFWQGDTVRQREIEEMQRRNAAVSPTTAADADMDDARGPFDTRPDPPSQLLHPRPFRPAYYTPPVVHASSSGANSVRIPGSRASSIHRPFAVKAPGSRSGSIQLPGSRSSSTEIFAPRASPPPRLLDVVATIDPEAGAVATARRKRHNSEVDAPDEYADEAFRKRYDSMWDRKNSGDRKWSWEKRGWDNRHGSWGWRGGDHDRKGPGMQEL